MQNQQLRTSYLHRHRLRLAFTTLSLLVLIFACLDFSGTHPEYWNSLFTNYAYFFLIGLVAAIVANSTGAGGGIVFLPAFMSLGLSPTEALATSFAIQCFGMTSGSISWLNQRQHEIATHKKQWEHFPSLLFIAFITTLIGLFFVQWNGIAPPIDIHKLFSIFSLIVALIIFYRSFFVNTQCEGRVGAISYKEYAIMIGFCLIGGAITAWISIGIGEILAVVLIILGFRVHMAIALAVCISSLTVLSAVPYHVIITQSIDVNILFFAAPGAIIGGAIAKKFATTIGIKPLKIFMASWIAISAIIYLI